MAAKDIALADGSFVVGTMHVFRESDTKPPLGGLYRLDTRLRLHKLDDGLGITNGPCVNPVSGRLHVADSAARVVYSYAIGADGTLADKRVFVRTDAQDSGRTAAASTAKGACGPRWCAWALARFDLQGRLTHQFALPVAHPSALCFGGPAMDDLFVTTISDSGRLSASGPMDGGVLKLTGLGFSGGPRPECRLPL